MSLYIRQEEERGTGFFLIYETFLLGRPGVLLPFSIIGTFSFCYLHVSPVGVSVDEETGKSVCLLRIVLSLCFTVY